ncbi:hypothetical protein [Prosthecobacter algae]|uniref:hypothetical protein n=1 Tax=Prosthecobacter algae TaxID=1144682 RepID=UPI0031ED5495
MAKPAVNQAKSPIKRRIRSRTGKAGTTGKVKAAPAKSRRRSSAAKDSYLSEVMHFIRSLADHQARSRKTVLRVR